MKKAILVAISCGVLCVWGASVWGADSPAKGDGASSAPSSTPAQPRGLDRLPEAVRKTALKEAGEHRIHGIEKETKKGKPVWAVEWMDGKKEVEVFIAEDGSVVDREEKEIVPQPRAMTRLEMREDMKKVLGLNDEQLRKIAALDAALDKAAAKWQADNATKVQEAQKGLFTSRDGNTLGAAIIKLQALQAPYDELIAKAGDEVQAVLTPEQQATWRERAVINLSINVWFARAKLTAEQQAAIKTAYAELAKEKDAKVAAIQIALAEKVRDMISDEQLKALGCYLMQTEWSFHMSTSGPATVSKGEPAKSAASVDGGLLMLPVPKLMKTGVVAVGGGYAGITGPHAVGNSIVSQETED